MSPERKSYLVSAAAEAQPYPPEQKLAETWLAANIDRYQDLEWQVRVGIGLQLGGDYEEAIQRMAYQATRRRVDLVGVLADSVELIELKDHVDLAAVRQALDYAALWKIAPTTPPVSAIRVVGNTGNADIISTAGAHGVTVELLSPARS
jgi:hypothetical protein